MSRYKACNDKFIHEGLSLSVIGEYALVILFIATFLSQTSSKRKMHAPLGRLRSSRFDSFWRLYCHIWRRDGAKSNKTAHIRTRKKKCDDECQYRYITYIDARVRGTRLRACEFIVERDERRKKRGEKKNKHTQLSINERERKRLYM